MEIIPALRRLGTNYKVWTRDILYDLAGAVLISIGIKIFSAPNQIAPGGVNGIATLINYVTGLPIGTMALLMNIPLLLIAYRHLGKSFVFCTLRTLLIYTVAVDLLFGLPPTVYTGDKLLAALFGGLFSGLGGGLIFMHGSTAGGADIVTRLVQKRYPYYSVGQLVLGINGVIMVAAALVYRNIEAALYGLIMTFTSGRVIDGILYGADVGKCCMIVTSKPAEMGRAIIEQLKRSATILDGTGAYRHSETWMLVCVVRKQEYYHLKRVIGEVDPAAFVIVSEAQQIMGRGFKDIHAADN